MTKIYFRTCGNSYKEQHAAARELLFAAASYMGYEADESDIEILEGGKPIFREIPLYFSLSHSGSYVACAIGDTPCGVDLQEIKEVSERISKKYLGGAVGKAAVVRWTELESYGKLTGKGVSGLSDRSTCSKECFHSFDVLNGYVLTVCVSGEVSAPTEL